MEEKKRIKVNFFELSAAFELNFIGNTPYLDTETGEVIWVTDETRRDLEELWEEIPEDAEPIAALESYLAQSDAFRDWQREELLNAARVEVEFGSRYLAINPEPYSDYNDMEKFVRTLKDDRLAERFARAIQGSGAFRRFKDLLARHPQIEQAWYDFQAKQIEARMRSWLSDYEIEPVD